MSTTQGQVLGLPKRLPPHQRQDRLDTDGYICPRLASYAAASGVLDTLVADAGYLAVADPIRLVSAPPTLADGRARETADVYRRIAHELPVAEPLEGWR